MSRLPKPTAIAFDLDGTLIDSRGDIARACNVALVEAGREPLDDSAIAGLVGDGARVLLAKAFDLPKESPELDVPFSTFVRVYAADPIPRTHYLPGALQTLNALGKFPLGLITNKTRLVTGPILVALGLESLFQFVFAGGDGPLKPDPYSLQRFAEAVSCPLESVWLVGDGLQDIGCAKSAGATCVSVLGGFHGEDRLRAAEPHAVIASLFELPDLVRLAVLGD